MKFKKIKSRLVAYITSFVIVTIIIISFVVSTIYNNELLKNLKVITDQNLQIVNYDLEEQIASVKRTFLNIQERDDLQDLLLSINEEENNYDLISQVSNIMREYAYSDVGITSIFLLDLDGNVLDPLYLMEPYSEIIKSYGPLNDYLSSDSGTKFSLPSSFPIKLEDENSQKTTISYFDKILSNDNYEAIGTVIITSKLSNMFSEFNMNSIEKFDEVFVIDEEGNMIMKLSEGNIDDGLLSIALDDDRKSSVVKVKEREYYYNYKTLDEYKHWSVVGFVEYDRLKSVISVIYESIMVTMMVGFILIVIISYVFASKITKPILKLRNAMNHLSKGEWPEPLRAETDDELKDLIEGFNYMVDEQQILIEQIYAEQEKKKEYEVQSISLKLDLLQSQINPHFIHNTLNAIQYLIKAEKPQEAEKVLRSFNLLLRSSMAHEKDFITLREEIDCIKSYVEIQKVRYDDIFDMKFEIDERYMDVMVPKLILQPIVENSIFHGIVPKGDRGSIIINVNGIKELIRICVVDDGVGMSAETQDKLMSGDEKGLYSNYNGISFTNINNRLKLAYGNYDGLKIDSKIGIGTNISFEIPSKRDEL